MPFTEIDGYWMHFDVFGGDGSHDTINRQEGAPWELLIVR